MERRTCPFCEAELPTGATVCHLCGHDLHEASPLRRFWVKARGWLILIAVIVLVCAVLLLARAR